MNKENKTEKEGTMSLEGVYLKISYLLVPNWKTYLAEGRKLRDLIDPVELCRVKISEINRTENLLSKEDFAELKIKRLYWKTKYSVLARNGELKGLEEGVESLKDEKERLRKEKTALEKEITGYEDQIRYQQ